MSGWVRLAHPVERWRFDEFTHDQEAMPRSAVCLRLITWSAINAKLSHTNMGESKPIPAGKLRWFLSSSQQYPLAAFEPERDWSSRFWLGFDHHGWQTLDQPHVL